MNAIETMERDIRSTLPTAWTRLRRPRKPQGEWWLDAKQDDHVVTIQWSPRRGFGVSASALGDGYGEGPEETFENREHAAARVLVLLRTKGTPYPLRVSCSGSSGDWSELRRRSWRESLAFSRRLSRDSNVATTLRWVHSDAPWPHWERIWRSTFEPRKATAFGLLVPPTRRDRRSRSVPTSVTPPRPAPRPPAPRPGCARPPPAPRGRPRPEQLPDLEPDPIELEARARPHVHQHGPVVDLARRHIRPWHQPRVDGQGHRKSLPEPVQTQQTRFKPEDEACGCRLPLRDDHLLAVDLGRNPEAPPECPHISVQGREANVLPTLEARKLRLRHRYERGDLRLGLPRRGAERFEVEVERSR